MENQQVVFLNVAHNQTNCASANKKITKILIQ